MNLYRVLPPPPEVFDLKEPQSHRALVEMYRPDGDHSARAIMVTNSAGDTVSPEGSSTQLSRGADRALLAALREDADAVVVGASTIRHELVPLPRHTPLVVLSASGDLRGHQLLSRHAPEERLIIATPAEHHDHLAEALREVPWEPLAWNPGNPPEELADAVRALVNGGHLLIEGGQMTWEYCAPLTTELLISTTPPPRDHHQGIPPWWPTSLEDWELRSLLTDDDKMLYYRHVAPAAARPPV